MYTTRYTYYTLSIHTTQYTQYFKITIGDIMLFPPSLISPMGVKMGSLLIVLSLVFFLSSYIISGGGEGTEFSNSLLIYNLLLVPISSYRRFLLINYFQIYGAQTQTFAVVGVAFWG